MISTGWVLAVGAAVVGHWLCPRRQRTGYHIAVAVGMLAVASPAGFVGLSVATAVAFLGSRDRSRRRTVAALVAIGGVFVAAKTVGGANASDPKGVVPMLGFAFTAPRVAHVVIDVRTKRLAPPKLGALIGYLWFWPLLVIGPIHRFGDHEREMRRHRFDTVLFAQGVERIVFGLFSVVVLGNVVVGRWLGEWIDAIDSSRAGLVSALRSIEYGGGLYVAFAGWSAVAIGVANLQGIRVRPNFSRPFLGRNIAEFWRGWHMSLTSWATEYLYRPVVAQWRNHIVAVGVTMVAIGLWHEFSTRYVLWGAYHAVGLAVHRRFRAWRGAPPPGRARTIAATLVTAAFVVAGFTITRTSGPADAARAFDDLIRGGW